MSVGRAAGTALGGARTDAQNRFVALLRGVNVGGRTLPMQQLRDLVASLGHTDVVTYIQSGNVLFGSGRDDRDAIAHEIRAAIDATVGHDVTVVLRTPAELERVIGRQQTDLHFFREALRLWDAQSPNGAAPVSTASSKK